MTSPAASPAAGASRRADLGLAGLSTLAVALTLSVHAVANRPAGARGGPYLAVHAALGLVMLGAAWLTRRGCSPAGVRALIVGGVLARLALLPVAPFTTHDVERYLWDGHLAAEGVDPYRVAPGAPEAAALTAAWPTPSEHTGYTTLYPPLALALFAVCAVPGDPGLALLAWKSCTTAASLAILLAVAWLLRRRGALAYLPLVAFHPLLLLEGGVGAHVDILAALGVVAALALLHADRSAGAGAALGLGVLAKLSPLVAAVPLALRRPRAGAAAVCAILAGYAVALSLGLRPYGSLGVFVERWRFGSPIFAALEAIAGGAALPLAALLGALGLGALGLRAWRARAQDPSASLAAEIALALALLWALSPVVFPWYLVPLAALAALAPRPWLLAWTLLHPATYELLDRFDATGRWEPASWPLWIIAAGVAVAALFGRTLGLVAQRLRGRGPVRPAGA